MINRVVAAVLCALLAPLLVTIAFAICLTTGRPVLFRQPRGGLRGTVFEILKFRTMRAPSTLDESDDVRVTRIGKLLRRTSLDELPSLWNIVRGDMVFIGPRPLIAKYLAYYDDHQARRLDVKPGLTGLAQVCGRNALPWEEKFEIDVWYVDHRSMWLDARIIGKTIVAVLRGSGISAEGSATMPEFRGTVRP